MKVKVLVAQLRPTLCDLVVCTVQGILQARTLEWVAISFSRGSSWPRDETRVSHIADKFFTVWATQMPLYIHPPPSHSSLCLMGLTCMEFIHRVPSPPLPVCLGKGEHQQLTRRRRRFRLELNLIYPLAQLLSGDPLHAAFWSQFPVSVASPILSGFGEVTSSPQAVSSLRHYIILCGVSTHICVCNLFVLSSWLKPKGLFPVSTLSDTLRCQVIIHLPNSGTGMSQVEENEGELKYEMKRESPDATKIWISVPGTLVSTALPSISSVTLVDSMANRQVTRSQWVSMPIWVEFSITCHEVYQDSSWLMKLQGPEIYWASKIVDLVV